jgi:hypothetical protein
MDRIGVDPARAQDPIEHCEGIEVGPASAKPPDRRDRQRAFAKLAARALERRGQLLLDRLQEALESCFGCATVRSSVHAMSRRTRASQTARVHARTGGPGRRPGFGPAPTQAGEKPRPRL